jgi:integrase
MPSLPPPRHTRLYPDGGLINIGVPFGPKARLIAMWMATEVQNPRRNTRDRILELNGITDWLEALGIPARGGATGSIAATKDQFMRLAFSTFTMVLRGPNSEELFKRESLIESGIFSGDDLALYRAGQVSQMAWPRVIALTHTGCREGELAAMTIEDFNPDVGTVRVRTSKSGKPRHVVLTQAYTNSSRLAVGWPAVQGLATT